MQCKLACHIISPNQGKGLSFSLLMNLEAHPADKNIFAPQAAFKIIFLFSR
jgi:hypothetical protein